MPWGLRTSGCSPWGALACHRPYRPQGSHLRRSHLPDGSRAPIKHALGGLARAILHDLKSILTADGMKDAMGSVTGSPPNMAAECVELAALRRSLAQQERMGIA